MAALPGSFDTPVAEAPVLISDRGQSGDGAVRSSTSGGISGGVGTTGRAPSASADREGSDPADRSPRAPAVADPAPLGSDRATSVDPALAGTALAGTALAGTALADPELVDPALPGTELVDPDLADPALADTELVDPALVDPALADTALVDPDLADPELVDPALADTELVDPELADPDLIDPALADPTLMVCSDPSVPVTATDTAVAPLSGSPVDPPLPPRAEPAPTGATRAFVPSDSASTVAVESQRDKPTTPTAPPVPARLPAPLPPPAPAGPVGCPASSSSGAWSYAAGQSEHADGIHAVLDARVTASLAQAAVRPTSGFAGAVIRGADDPGVRPG